MSSLALLSSLLAFVWAAAVASTDYRSRRIPNRLLLAALIPTLLYLSWRGETPLHAGWFDAVAGLFAGLFLLLPGHLLGRLGAGDVKLAAVLGLVQGLHGVLLTLLLAALVLGEASLFVLRRFGAGQAATMKLPAGLALCAGFVCAAGAQAWLA